MGVETIVMYARTSSGMPVILEAGVHGVSARIGGFVTIPLCRRRKGELNRPLRTPCIKSPSTHEPGDRSRMRDMWPITPDDDEADTLLTTESVKDARYTADQPPDLLRRWNRSTVQRFNLQPSRKSWEALRLCIPAGIEVPIFQPYRMGEWLESLSANQSALVRTDNPPTFP